MCYCYCNKKYCNNSDFISNQLMPLNSSKNKVSVGKTTKSTIVKTVATNLSLSDRLVKAVFDEIFSVLENEISSGKKIVVHGFGSFEPKYVKNKTCKNPKTQQDVHCPEKIVPHFVAGKLLSEALQQKKEELINAFKSQHK